MGAPIMYDEVANLPKEAKMGAVGRALVERRARLRARAGKPSGRKNLREHLEHVWPTMPAGELGRVMGREEEDRVLGYGPDGF
jgi:antitoxin VapB